MKIKIPTLKQFGYYKFICREIGEEIIYQRCYSKFGNKFGRLLPEQAEKVIRYFYLKYSLPEIPWIRENVKSPF